MIKKLLGWWPRDERSSNCITTDDKCPFGCGSPAMVYSSSNTIFGCGSTRTAQSDRCRYLISEQQQASRVRQLEARAERTRVILAGLLTYAEYGPPEDPKCLHGPNDFCDMLCASWAAYCDCMTSAKLLLDELEED